MTYPPQQPHQPYPQQPYAPQPPQQPYPQQSQQQPYPQQQPYAQQPYQSQQPPYYGPQPPAPKKAKTWPWVVGIVVALIAGGSIVYFVQNTNTSAASPSGTSAPADQAAGKVKTVVYEVTGTGKALGITYTTDGKTATEQVGDVALPWSKTIELPAGEAVQVVQVLAQSSGDGPVTATITVDGKVVKTGKTSGPYSVVSVNESIGALGK